MVCFTSGSFFGVQPHAPVQGDPYTAQFQEKIPEKYPITARNSPLGCIPKKCFFLQGHDRHIEEDSILRVMVAPY